MVKLAKQIVFAFTAIALIFAPLLTSVAPRAEALSVGGIVSGVTGGGSVPVGVTKNTPEAVLQNAKNAAVLAVGKIAKAYLQERLNKIEQNYKISNFLFYSDALVQGQYLPDFLNKYVPNAQDQQMIKYMIPQFACTGDQNSPTFQAQKAQLLQQKARNYLGFDPTQLQPGDPDFYSKMAKLGDVYSNPTGWDLQLQAVAAQAQAAAEQAAQNEINSPGIKTARTSGGINSANSGGDIAVTVNNIVASESSALLAQLQNSTLKSEFATNLSSLGGDFVSGVIGGLVGDGAIGSFLQSQAGMIASGVISSLTTNVFNDLTQATFIKGAVLVQEKKTCLDDTVQITPVSQPTQSDTNQAFAPDNSTVGGNSGSGSNGGGGSSTGDQSLNIQITASALNAKPDQSVIISWDASQVVGASYAVKSWDNGTAADIIGSDTVTIPSNPDPTGVDYSITVYDGNDNPLGTQNVHIYIDTGPRG